jgi:hypothetical protein
MGDSKAKLIFFGGIYSDLTPNWYAHSFMCSPSWQSPFQLPPEVWNKELGGIQRALYTLDCEAGKIKGHCKLPCLLFTPANSNNCQTFFFLYR